MKNKDGGEGEGGLINFPPLKRGGLKRGFTVIKIIARYLNHNVRFSCEYRKAASLRYFIS